MHDTDRSTAIADVCDGASRPDEDVLSTLADPRHRRVLAAVEAADGPIPPAALADRIAARRLDRPREEVSEDERRDALALLHHVHLPRLADAGLIEVGPAGRVRRVDRPAGERARAVVPTASDGDHGATAGDRDALYGALSHRHRRIVLSVVEERGDRSREIPLDALAVAVARREGRREADGAGEGGTWDREARLAVSLHHSHLSKLADAGLLSYDPGRRVVTGTDGDRPDLP